VTYDIVFVVASVVAIAAALMVVLSPNPFISALSLIANLIALATLYLLLQSDFLAAAQVIVYAGAVMIMFLFVTAYLGGRADEPTGDRPVWQTVAALIAAALNLLRPSLAFFAVALATAGFGIVLYNVALSALAVGLLIVSFARRAPEPE